MIKIPIPHTIKILLAHPTRNDATNFYRALGPLIRMEKDGMIELIDGSIQGYEFSWANLMKCDILFFQRPVGKDHLAIIEMAKRLKKPVWCDWDDDYLNIPSNNPRYESYHIEGRQYSVEDCIRAADIISVSTQAIADTYVNINRNVVVIPNAYDETLFAPPEKRSPEKIVLFRAGDTHKANLEHYKEDILKCIREYPQYTWCFMGMSIPLWLTEASDIPNERLRLYDFTELMNYFEFLMEIHPEIVIAPLENTQFNRSRSNNIWIEGTLAGAVVVATELPEFKQMGVIPAPVGNFKAGFDLAVTCNQDVYFEASKQSIPSLGKVNKLRFDLVHQLLEKASKSRITPKKLKQPGFLSDEDFFKYYLKMGWTQETVSHRDANYKAVDWMIDTFAPKRVLELGSGPGLMLERFHQEQVFALGIEKNQYFVDYFRQRNPLTGFMTIQGDITDELEFPEPFDLVISIEVFEHIDQPEEKWDAMLTKLAQNAKWFVFSSTPYRSGAEFDIQWGHVNVRRYEKWKELFARNGWEFHSNPNKIISWDAVFKSTIFGAETIVVK